MDVLFLHWRAPPHLLRDCLPTSLAVATFEGDAWLSAVAFRLRVRRRGMPFLPGFTNLVELNLRTYVLCGEQPGIWFLSAHADNVLAMRVATWLTPMPYVQASMDYRLQGDVFRISAQRRLAQFAATFALTPGAPFRETPADSLDAWLLERYRLYASRPRGPLTCADVTHPPWRAQRIGVTQTVNRLGAPWGIDLSRDPDLAHFSPGVQAHFGVFQPCEEPPFNVANTSPAREAAST